MTEPEAETPARRRIRFSLLDLFYPRDCLISGAPLGNSTFRYISDEVAARLPMIRDPRCPCCGHPFFGAIEDGPVCVHCEDLDPAFETGRCGYLLSRDCRTLVHSFKYERKRYLAPDLARLLAAAPGFLDFLDGAVVVPVPIHPRKLRRRGFNQTEEILRHLAGHIPGGLDVRPLLRRTVDTVSQTRANRKERMKRVRDAFALDEDAPLPERHARCVLFDDIFTTGATLNACAEVLRSAGLLRIDAAAFAHG
ncbi:MAG: ComF family protein [Puniceicoccaceae bacterium]